MMQDQRAQQIQQAAQIQQAIRLLEMQREKLATVASAESVVPQCEPPKLQRQDNMFPDISSHQGTFHQPPAIKLTASLSSIFGSGEIPVQNFNTSPAGSFNDPTCNYFQNNCQKDPLGGIFSQSSDIKDANLINGQSFPAQNYFYQNDNGNYLNQSHNTWPAQSLGSNAFPGGHQVAETETHHRGNYSTHSNIQAQHSFSQQLDLPRNYPVVPQTQVLFQPPTNDTCQTSCWSGPSIVPDLSSATQAPSICTADPQSYFSQTSSRFQQQQSQQQQQRADYSYPAPSITQPSIPTLGSMSSSSSSSSSCAWPSQDTRCFPSTPFASHPPAHTSTFLPGMSHLPSAAGGGAGQIPAQASPALQAPPAGGHVAGVAHAAPGRPHGNVAAAAAAAQSRPAMTSAAAGGGSAEDGAWKRPGLGAPIGPSSSGKLVLTAESACAIYALRPRAGERKTGKSHSQSNQIAAMHGVTAKTIRDIWNRSTWAKATRHLWTDDELAQYVEQRKRMSAKLDPSQGLPTWCTEAAAGSSPS